MKIKTPVILLTAATFALSGCVKNAPGEQGNRTQSGAVIGALVGGAFGATRKGDNKLAKTAAGAAIGGLVGGLIGSNLDKQAQELRSNIGNGDVKIVNTGSELIVTMPQDILFRTDSALVRSDLRSDLLKLATSLQKYPDTTVDILGHTDNTGTAAYNQNLSARRADSVATVLMDAGVAPSRIRALGRGEDVPVASNLTVEGRSQNRRVEIVIRPISR
ncbi:MAG TPA: hypothetical protein DD729_07300 [Rhodobacteraceae bacterium]|jgi:outer membrane protein OmpA-like peptidoglycan-associated protein|nr:hypothetical protein [Paracoccaceae bacterium]